MQKGARIVSVIAVFVFAIFVAYAAAGELFLPDRVCVATGDEFAFGRGLLTIKTKSGTYAEVAAGKIGSYNATLYLFDLLPLKTVRVSRGEKVYLVPGGMTFGVKMFTAGVVVVGLADVRGASGSSCPAREAGIELGDVVLSVDDTKIKGNDDLCAIVEASDGRSLKVEFTRDDVRKTVYLNPICAKNGTGYKAGMWVRDSSAGVGTITYINEKSGVVAGLGHGVTDSDTGVVMPLASGEIVPVTITGVTRGQAGAAGELKGMFEQSNPYATLEYNCASGVYGAVTRPFYVGGALPVAYKQDIEVGPARVLCTVDGGPPAYYEATIDSINLSDAHPSKNIVIRITDEKLIEKTGGIVQGMSGSPIIQNGCVVGAITHVFVNDPTKGYGVFIENMLANEANFKINKKFGNAA
ncbi:MAG: SpoIVB peptidase [Oscillospiraceae bacterium]